MERPVRSLSDTACIRDTRALLNKNYLLPYTSLIAPSSVVPVSNSSPSALIPTSLPVYLCSGLDYSPAPSYRCFDFNLANA